MAEEMQIKAWRGENIGEREKFNNKLLKELLQHPMARSPTGAILPPEKERGGMGGGCCCRDGEKEEVICVRGSGNTK